MFNIYPHNQSKYNEQGAWTSQATQGEIVYNGFELQSENFIITSTNFDSSHEVESETYNKPLTHWIWQLNYLFRAKTITFEWYIKWVPRDYQYWQSWNELWSDTWDDLWSTTWNSLYWTETSSATYELNNEIDRLKKLILTPSKNLDYKVNGNIRRAEASCVNPQSLMYRNHYNIDVLPVSLEFRTLSFAKEVTAQNTTLTDLTSGFTEIVYHSGTTVANPEIVLTFLTASWVSEIEIDTWQETPLVINESISASDIIRVDSETKDVTLNWVDIDYTGEFPELESWANTIVVSVNWTKNMDFSINYFNTYL